MGVCALLVVLLMTLCGVEALMHQTQGMTKLMTAAAGGSSDGSSSSNGCGLSGTGARLSFFGLSDPDTRLIPALLSVHAVQNWNHGVLSDGPNTVTIAARAVQIQN